MSRTSKGRRDARKKASEKKNRARSALRQKKRKEEELRRHRAWVEEQSKTAEQRKQEKEEEERRRTRYQEIRYYWWINHDYTGVPAVWSKTDGIPLYLDTWAKERPPLPDEIPWKGKVYILTERDIHRNRLYARPGPPPSSAFLLDDEGLRTPAGTLITRFKDFLLQTGQQGRRAIIPPAEPEIPARKVRFA